MSRVAIRNFTGGEMAPTLAARYDVERYGNAVASMQNMFPGLHGDTQRRPGTCFVTELDDFSVLVPFSFNADAAQNFVLVFSEQRLNIANAGGLVAAALGTPYRAADLYELSTAQVGDIVYIAHKNHPLHKLMRRGSPGAYTWELAVVALNSSLAAPAAPSCAFIRGNSEDTAELSYTLRYKIVAVDANGQQSLASPAGECLGKYPSDWVVGNHVQITWQGVAGAVEYNIYREQAGYYGFIGVVDASNRQNGSLQGIRLGTLVSGIVQAFGSVQRTVVIGNGMTEYVPGQGFVPVDRDETGPLQVEAQAQNAFLVDGKLFVWTTLTTTTTEWKRVYDEEGDFSWTPSTTTKTESFWAMTDCPSGNAIGSYATFQTGNLGSNTAYPEGSIGAYTVEPVFGAGMELSFTDNNFEADTADTPREDWNPFANGNNPSVVAFHQQRMVLAGTPNAPQAFYLSRTGDFENFRKSRPLQEDDPVEYLIASGSVDAVVWAASFGDLLLGTSGSEYKATGPNGIITAKEVNITAQSYWGSAGLAPLIIGNSILHVQRHGARVRDLFYSLEKDGYAGNDLSIFAPHLFDGHALKQWAYQQAPGSHVWIVRDDGVLLCLTYLKEHQIYGWSQHRTQGQVRSVCALSGENEDLVFLVVERELAGRRKYFLERLAPLWQESQTIEDAYFVDCGCTIRQPAPSREFAGLGHLEGCEVAVLADGSPVEGCTVSGGKIVIPYEATTVHVGLPFVSRLELLPIEADTQNGSTLGKRRAYGRSILRLYRSVGGQYGATGGTLYDIPAVPDVWGQACQPFSGDVELTPAGPQSPEASLVLEQQRPLPFHVLAVVLDVDFGEV